MLHCALMTVMQSWGRGCQRCTAGMWDIELDMAALLHSTAASSLGCVAKLLWTTLGGLMVVTILAGTCCVQAHECGHQAFSESQSINDAVGLILHSCLLVPYYSW